MIPNVLIALKSKTFLTVIWVCFVFNLIIIPGYSNTFEVGPGKPFSNPVQAAQLAQPGDTVLIYPAIYPGGYYISDIHGLQNQPIYFLGKDVGQVIFQGNSEALHFSDVSYLQIENVTVTGQTGNGMNIDDGGTFDSPSHHVIVLNCRFLDMAGQGNNDLLKLSGVDNFSVVGCIFKNGAAGGSGIDMVGCHQGTINSCHFENLGSNSIQAKGGSQYLEISQNWFKNGGQRVLNLGGSTGLAFFRPQNAIFEAADIDVFTNVIVGGFAAIAYVGSRNVRVFNNTLVQPQNWVIRILQETVDTSRFLPCGSNSFVNNIVYYFSTLSRHVNVGPNTASESFLFSNNLWFNADDPQNSTPNLPSIETNGLRGTNPLFTDFNANNFFLSLESPAIDAGMETPCEKDYAGNIMPSGSAFDIGAFEWQANSTGNQYMKEKLSVFLYPNPFSSYIFVHNPYPNPLPLLIFSTSGHLVFSKKNIAPGVHLISLEDSFTPGNYFGFVGNQAFNLLKQ